MNSQKLTGLEVAIIGFYGRFNNVESTDGFWDLQMQGKESFSHFNEVELNELGIDRELYSDKHYIKKNGHLKEKEWFDADFFGYSPSEAEIMDPQSRIFHEIVWNGLESSGYIPEKTSKKIGIYAGANNNTLWQTLALIDPDSFDPLSTDYLTNKDYLCSLISYKLNLTGPAVFIQTACSTSLVAVHQGARAVLTGECDIAIAGGVSVSLLNKGGYLYKENHIYSHDGHCRAFDAKANGTMLGEGGGVVILKKYKDAVLDGDTIHAIIKGSAVNNDGKNKVGFVAPGVEGHMSVIYDALRSSKIAPSSISYLEAHGTGTKLGDVIEFSALSAAYKSSLNNHIPIGSVKANIGHLDSAAGIASLIKGIFCLKNRKYPPIVNFETPNPQFDYNSSSLLLSQDGGEFSTESFPLRIGVSSLGIGGTNCHVIIEEAPILKNDNSFTHNGPYLFVLSAQSVMSLKKYCSRLSSDLKSNLTINLDDVCYTLSCGRADFKYRISLKVNSLNDLISSLESCDLNIVKVDTNKARETVFFINYSIENSLDIVNSFYDKYPLFSRKLDEGFDVIQQVLNLDLKKEFYKDKGFRYDESIDNRSHNLFIFVVNYLFIKMIRDLGLNAFTCIESNNIDIITELLSSELSLKDVIILLVDRMLYSGLFNSPNTNLSKLDNELLNRDFGRISYSNSHIKAKKYLKDANCHLISLGNLSKEFTELLYSEGKKQSEILEISSKNNEIQDQFLIMLSNLWKSGSEICLYKLFEGMNCKRIALSVYPYERKRFPIKKTWMKTLTSDRVGNSPLINSVESLFYDQSWVEKELIVKSSISPENIERTFLIFCDDSERSKALINGIESRGYSCIKVLNHEYFNKVNDKLYYINLSDEDHYYLLLEKIKDSGFIPNTIMHFFDTSEVEVSYNNLNDALDINYLSIVFSVNACERAKFLNIKDFVVTFSVTGDSNDLDKLNAFQQLSIGAIKVLSTENQNIRFKGISISAFDLDGSLEIMRELESGDKRILVAYRNNKRFVPKIKKIEPRSLMKDRKLKTDGCYLVIGGTGGMGFSVAYDLAIKSRGNVIIIGKKEFPVKSDWRRCLSDDSISEYRKKMISKILDAERLGASISVLSCSVSDYSKMNSIIKKLMDEYGNINGVIWAAGEIDEGGIALKRNAPQLIDPIKSKVHGLLNIFNLLDIEKLDFFSLFSSSGNLFYKEKFGQIAYNVANEFISGIAKNFSNYGNIYAIEWCDWKDVGMTIRSIDKQLKRISGEEYSLSQINDMIDDGIDPELGVEIFWKSINSNINYCIISNNNLENTMDLEKYENQIDEDKFEIFSLDKSNNPRPELNNEYVPPSNSIQLSLCEIMIKLFGFDNIGVNDDFFELGGDSLRAIQFINQVNQHFGSEISYHDFLENPSIIWVENEIA